MRKLVCSALALSAAITPAVASEGDWLSLDQELEAFPTLLDNHEGPHISGFILATYRYTDGMRDSEGPDETSDFAVERARVYLDGDIGNSGYTYNLQLEAAETDDLIILDAYVTFPVAGGVKGQFGNQRVPFLRSALLDRGRLFFLNRTANGEAFRDRQESFQVMGEADALRWYASIADGKDGGGTDHQFTARVEFDAMGEPLHDHEGSQGGSDDPSLMIAAAFSSDGGAAVVNGQTVVGGQAFALEANVVTNVYSFGAEIINYSENDNGVASISGVNVGDSSTPFALQGTFVLSPGNDDGSDSWEAGLRFEDFDDAAETTRITAAVNNYLLPNHKLKWQIQYSSTMVDRGGGDDVDELAVGLIASF
ncbi:MAG: hypothetical protein AB8H79_07180 [Myxococcota bacterium]